MDEVIGSHPRQTLYSKGVKRIEAAGSFHLDKTTALPETGAAAADAIEAQLRRAKAAIERNGHALLIPFLSEESAHLARLLGDEEGCERHFREAHRLYTEMDPVKHAERVERELVLIVYSLLPH